MAYITTTLGMKLADPATVQAFETVEVNADFIILENAILADRVDIAALTNGVGRGSRAIYYVADLDGVALITDEIEGDLCYIDEGNFYLQRNDADWVQVTAGTFVDAAARDAAFAKASAAYLVAGARARLTGTDRVSEYMGTAWIPMPRASFEPVAVASSGSGVISSSGAFADIPTVPITHDLVVPRACKAKITLMAGLNATTAGGGVGLGVKVSGATTVNPVLGAPDTIYFIAASASDRGNFTAIAIVDLVAGTNTISLQGRAIGSGSTRTCFAPSMLIEPLT